MVPMSLLIMACVAQGSGQPSEIVPEKTYTVVYNVQDLEMIVPNRTNRPNLDLYVRLTGENKEQFVSQKDTNWVIDSVIESIDYDDWIEGSRIRYWNGNLIIKATRKVHDSIK